MFIKLMMVWCISVGKTVPMVGWKMTSSSFQVMFLSKYFELPIIYACFETSIIHGTLLCDYVMRNHPVCTSSVSYSHTLRHGWNQVMKVLSHKSCSNFFKLTWVKSSLFWSIPSQVQVVKFHCELECKSWVCMPVTSYRTEDYKMAGYPLLGAGFVDCGDGWHWLRMQYWYRSTNMSLSFVNWNHLVPDDCEFKKVAQCTTGRVYILKFKSSSRKYFFWMQVCSLGFCKFVYTFYSHKSK